MKICLISFDNWGFNNYIADCLIQEGHTVSIIDFSKFNFKYPHLIYRVYNSFLKFFLNKNLKTFYYGERIINELDKLNNKQDVILTIKGDFIAPKYAIKIKKYTHNSIAFFNDSTKKCPKILQVLDCFDEVYSFDKNDCEKYNLKFKSNFIYETSIQKNIKNEFDLFYISSFDKRYKTIENISKILHELNLNCKILMLNPKKPINTNYITPITESIPLNEIQEYINKSNVLLDIQRKKQLGLTFRVFESLGLEKKLITTNKDIITYDFYNPNNILVIDTDNPIINKDFFTTPYAKIPDEVIEKYLLKGWTKEILKNDK